MTDTRPRVDTITDNQLDQLHDRLEAAEAARDRVRRLITDDPSGIFSDDEIRAALDEARQATAPEQPDDDEPLELPRDTVQALHDLTAQLLGTQPSEALRLSEQRLDQVLADRNRERHVLTGKMRENEQLRSELAEAGKRADQTEAALIKARRRIGELTTSLDQAHGSNSGLWRAHAESVSQAGGHQAIADQAKAERDQALAVGTALKTALTELAHQARLDPDVVECVHGITDRWRYNGVSSLAQYADTLLAALNDPEPT